MSCLVVSPVAGCVVVAIICSLRLVVAGCLSPPANCRSLAALGITTLKLSCALAAAHNSVENNIAHPLRERFGIAVDAWVIPSVNPVDHAEQAHHRSACVEIETALAPQVFHQPEADVVVLALDSGDFRTQAVFQRLVFMRKDFQSLLIAHEIFEVIEDEDADPLLGVRDILDPRFERFENSGKCVLLNEVQEALFRLEVVIQPRQRHTGRARQIAHRCSFISLLAEDFCGMVEDLSEAPVETSLRRTTRRSAGNRDAASGSAGYWQGGHTFERSF